MRNLALVTGIICVLSAGTPADSATLQEWSECRAAPPQLGISACTRIIEDPASNRCERAVGYADRAMNRRRIGDIDGALADANEAVRLDGAGFPRSVRAKVWLDRGDYDRALDDLTETIRREGSAHGYVERGIVLFAKGDFAAPMISCTRAVPALMRQPGCFLRAPVLARTIRAISRTKNCDGQKSNCFLENVQQKTSLRQQPTMVSVATCHSLLLNALSCAATSWRL
jgi:hypothetical protein